MDHGQALDSGRHRLHSIDVIAKVGSDKLTHTHTRTHAHTPPAAAVEQ